MNISFFIAKRYFVSKKTRMSNLISLVALLATSVCSAAMIVILSVMNGMNSFVAERFSRFDPDLKIEKVTGKYFNAEWLAELSHIDGVAKVIPTIETQALILFQDATRVVILKGTTEKKEHSFYTPVTVGGGVAASLDISERSHLLLYTLPASTINPQELSSGYNAFDVVATDFLTTIPDYDNRYIIAPLEFVQKAIDKENRYSAVEMFLVDGDGANTSSTSETKIKAKIQQITGNDFTVKNRQQQQDTLYSSMKIEKLIIIVIFVFVMLISCFTLIASLMLLINDKKKDNFILKSIGMTETKVRQNFLLNGIFITALGTIAGLITGIAITLCQQFFGWVKLGGSGSEGKYIVEAYPVLLQPTDILLVFCISIAVGFFASVTT
ncbi:MAG: FtsX-like permease family protein, partial [Bacteroidales bacterium]|nr:FtsX-like permease family protein [Bacteroidales bacterium]